MSPGKRTKLIIVMSVMSGNINKSFYRVLITFLTFVSFKMKCFLSIFIYDETTEGGSPGQVRF